MHGKVEDCQKLNFVNSDRIDELLVLFQLRNGLDSPLKGLSHQVEISSYFLFRKIVVSDTLDHRERDCLTQKDSRI